MDLNSTYIGRFFVNNFALLLISIVTLIIAIQHFKQHRRISTYTILTITSALLLAICSDLEFYAKATYVTGQEGLYYLAKACAVICYILRPACICFMILMSGHIIPRKYLWLFFVPLMINATIFLCAFIPGSAEIIFGFSKGDEGLGFVGGYLRYSVHIISALYLAYLVISVILNLKKKHFSSSIMLFVCTIFVIASVVIESFFNDSSTIQILNTVIVASTLVYYLYLFIQRTEIDGLTGLFNRETFYQDKRKMDTNITGVIQFDMNGLKYINDTFGHSEGDKALKTIADVISDSIKNNMYAYRLGGDEFVVLINRGEDKDPEETVIIFKEKLAKTGYHCSIGYSTRGNREISFKDLMKESEKAMYQDKEEFYKNAEFERRKAE
ncbi:MAG: GGDEF domain-containing protein [Bacilli bacterium]|nr:GGDEF domain-containing protein [Bacilli bacterium]